MSHGQAVAAPIHLKIRPSAGWAAVDVRELWRFRDLLWSLAERDVRLRYRQTALGVVWVVLQPLLGAGIFSFVFGVVGGMRAGNGVPYFVFSFTGLLCWHAFSHVLTKTSHSMIGNSHLVSKVYFPRLILPLSTSFSAMIDFAVGLAMLVALLVAFGVNPGPGVLLLPVWLALAVSLALGVGFLTSALTVSYRDVNYVMPVLTQFLLYASPVAYALAEVREKVSPTVLTLYRLNPMANLLEAFRWSLLGQGDLDGAWVAYSAAACAGVFVAGSMIFKKMERRFADVI